MTVMSEGNLDPTLEIDPGRFGDPPPQRTRRLGRAFAGALPGLVVALVMAGAGIYAGAHLSHDHPGVLATYGAAAVALAIWAVALVSQYQDAPRYYDLEGLDVYVHDPEYWVPPHMMQPRLKEFAARMENAFDGEGADRLEGRPEGWGYVSTVASLHVHGSPMHAPNGVRANGYADQVTGTVHLAGPRGAHGSTIAREVGLVALLRTTMPGTSKDDRVDELRASGVVPMREYLATDPGA